MALAPRTTRDASGNTFAVNFENNGNDAGPQTPVAHVVGEVPELLSDILARFDDPLDANITNEAVQATFDADTYPGYKQGQNVPVIDGSARITRVPRHLESNGSAQNAMGANANRNFLHLYNGSDTDQWYRYDGTAAVGGAGSIKLRPDDEAIWYGPGTPTGAISVICGTAGKILSAWEA
jgi:hypothetical protein